MIDPNDLQSIRDMIRQEIKSNANDAQFLVGPIPYHAHTGVDSPQVDGANLLTGNPYTPTLTAVTNVASSVAKICNYFLVGSLVTVSGRVTVVPTATVGTELGMSLPTPSRFTLLEQCGGTGFSLLLQQGAIIIADTTNFRASLQFVAQSTSSHDFTFSYTYRIV